MREKGEGSRGGERDCRGKSERKVLWQGERGSRMVRERDDEREGERETTKKSKER